MLFDYVITEFNNDPAGGYQMLYVYFNWFEAFLWMGISLFIFGRYLKYRRGRIEVLYSFYVFIFGITDVVEVYRLTLGLLSAKGIILLGILICRYYTLRNYVDKKYKL